jgi:hypothetical protein
MLQQQSVIATNADALPEEKHQHDEHYRMLHQQQSPS